MDTVRQACLAMARHFTEHRDEVLEQYRLIESTPTLAMTEGEIDRKWIGAIGAALAVERSPGAQRRARILAGAIFGAMRATLAEWGEGGAPTSSASTEALSFSIEPPRDPLSTMAPSRRSCSASRSRRPRVRRHCHRGGARRLRADRAASRLRPRTWPCRP
jgi:hypothetical protein